MKEINRVLRAKPSDAGMRVNLCDGKTLSAWIDKTYEVQLGRVEERRGASGPFPLPAHQTGRADFQHPAFRQTSCDAHAGQRGAIRIRWTPSEPNTFVIGNWELPSDEVILCRRRRKCLTRS